MITCAMVKYDRITVKQLIFKCRKFLRISRIPRDWRNFAVHEYYLLNLEIRKNFMHANGLWPKFVKFSWREMSLFYSIFLAMTDYFRFRPTDVTMPLTTRLTDGQAWPILLPRLLMQDVKVIQNAFSSF